MHINLQPDVIITQRWAEGLYCVMQCSWHNWPVGDGVRVRGCGRQLLYKPRSIHYATCEAFQLHHCLWWMHQGLNHSKTFHILICSQVYGLDWNCSNGTNIETVAVFFVFFQTSSNRYFVLSRALRWFDASGFRGVCGRPLLLCEKGQYGSRCSSSPVSSHTSVGAGRHVWCLQASCAA